MTQRHLEHAVAGATGESLRTVRRLGFSLQAAGPPDPDPDDLVLALDCPFCRRPVPYPGWSGGGQVPLAECLRCDVDFDFAAAEVYASGPGSARLAG